MNIGVVILAAGQGKRMHSDLPKVCHEVMGQAMVLYVYDQVKKAAPGASVCVVIGHGREKVQDLFKGMDISFAVQEQQQGTGHAVQSALKTPWGEKNKKNSILVLSGDTPLLTAEAIASLLAPLKKGTAVRMLTTVVEDPTGYGRVIRKGKNGPVAKIVEQKDASPKERAVCEINPAIYLFDAGFLFSNISGLKNKNAQSEFYLTDMIEVATQKKSKVEGVTWKNSKELQGVNNPWELATANQVLASRINRDWAMKGVFFTDPGEVWIDSTVKLSAGVRIEPNVILRGKTHIGVGAHVKAGTIIQDSVIEAGAVLGPYAHIRPDSHVGQDSKIGNFVELKKAKIGKKTAISHLSYVGDAIVGDRVNIGCGFVTCNYDGKAKHQTIIEDDVFMGSDCQVVAPLKVGRGAYIASGSTLTQDVPAESLAIARTRQVNKASYAKKFKKGP